MKTSIKLYIISLFFISLLDVTSIDACTIITAKVGETVIFGGNEDQYPNSSFLVVNPGGTFGVIYFATPWKQWP